jgi:hypothetical protein
MEALRKVIDIPDGVRELKLDLAVDSIPFIEFKGHAMEPAKAVDTKGAEFKSFRDSLTAKDLYVFHLLMCEILPKCGDTTTWLIQDKLTEYFGDMQQGEEDFVQYGSYTNPSITQLDMSLTLNWENFSPRKEVLEYE